MIYFIISLALTMIRLDHFVKDDFASLLNALTPFGFQSNPFFVQKSLLQLFSK